MDIISFHLETFPPSASRLKRLEVSVVTLLAAISLTSAAWAQTKTVTLPAGSSKPLAEAIAQWPRDTGFQDFSHVAGASDALDDRVIGSKIEAIVTKDMTASRVFTPPQIILVSNVYASPSLGGNQALSVNANGLGIINFQWFLNGVALVGQTNYMLTFPSVQITNLGLYTVVASNMGGATSNSVQLDVDPTFTKITTGPIVTDRAFGWGGAWGDYDNDGLIDLVVGVQGPNLLYHNSGDGTFTKITNSPIVTNIAAIGGLAWGDYDNDGALDLFSTEFGAKSRLYHNNGNGNFTTVTNVATQDSSDAVGPAWGDYDNDGFLDLVVIHESSPNGLYHSNGNGTFTKMTTNEVGVMADKVHGTFVTASVWGDYDDDGYLDMLFLADNGNSVLVHNNGDGTFTQVTDTPISALVGHSSTPVWADFFNSGRLDLFVANGGDFSPEDAWFLRNDGQAVFTRLWATNVGPVVPNTSQGFVGAAADYDNDGYLDLFVSNYGGQGSFLFHNKGDGTFDRVTTGSLVHDRAVSTGSAWGDYDNDGFMDLYVANGGWLEAQTGFLYRNSGINGGNTNHWLKLRLIGTTSNRSAIGTKVRLRGQRFGARPFGSGATCPVAAPQLCRTTSAPTSA